MTQAANGSSRPPTRFERRVYAMVQTIPRGQTRSYQWVARRLGNARLARAVGQALHRNPWPHRVPCHRVIRADGSLGGYAWGPARKRQRLQDEQRSIRVVYQVYLPLRNVKEV